MISVIKIDHNKKDGGMSILKKDFFKNLKLTRRLLRRSLRLSRKKKGHKVVLRRKSKRVTGLYLKAPNPLSKFVILKHSG